MPAKTKLTKEKRDQVIGALRSGADMAMAARAVDVSRAALYKLRDRDPEFCQATDEARDFADELVVKSLFDTARLGNVTACIFWLKNRKRDEWKDRHDHSMQHGNMKGDDGKPAVFKIEWAEGGAALAPGETVPESTDSGHGA